MASAVRVRPIPSEISMFAPLAPLSVVELRDGDRVRQRGGSTASTSSRRALPRKESSLLGIENKESSDASRRRPASICSALGARGDADSILSALKTEKRMTSTMGLREQEQHMVKIGRENWALKIDVTMLKKKRDELGDMNEKLTRQVETLSRENRELKRNLKRTKEELEKRERELDEACRMYDRLGATSIVLEKLSKKQVQQHHQQISPEEYIFGGNYTPPSSTRSPQSPRSPVMSSRPSSRSACSKSPQSASQAPEFLGPSIRASGRISPSPSIASSTSTRTGISRSGLQSPLPSNNKVQGLLFLSSPSVSTCCSLRRVPIPRHAASDDEEGDDNSSDEDMPTPQIGGETDDESDIDSGASDTDNEYLKKETPAKGANPPSRLATPKASLARAYATKTTPPSSVASGYNQRGSLRRKIMKFNREEEPDTSDSSEEEYMFDSDAGGSTTSLPHTLTPMTASPEPSKLYLFVPEGQNMDTKPKGLAIAAAAKRVGYSGSAVGDLEPIYERPIVNNAPSTYRYSMFEGLRLPDKFGSAASSVVGVGTRGGSKSRIPAPSTTSAAVQRRRRHLDSLSRLVVAREVLARKMVQV